MTKEEKNKRHHEYYMAHRYEILARKRERYASHPEKQKECVKRYVAGHRLEYNKYQAEYQRNHPELHRSSTLCYEYKKEHEFTCERCMCVGTSSTMHAHHIVPLLAGGEDTYDNLICLCPECHREIHEQIRSTK